MTTFRILLTLKSNQQVEGVCKDRRCACMVLYAPFPSNLICNMSTFRKKLFWPLTPPQGSRVCVRTECVFAWCSMFHSLLIWYTTWVLSEKKKCFDLLTPPSRIRGWGAVCGQDICYHVAAFVIPFNLICDMTMFWKCCNLTFWPNPPGSGSGSTGKIFATMLLNVTVPLIWYATWPYSEKVEFWPLPHPLSPPRGSDPGLWSKIKFAMFHVYCTSVCMRNFSKKYWQLSELLWNLNIWPLTPPKGSGGGVKF